MHLLRVQLSYLMHNRDRSKEYLLVSSETKENYSEHHPTFVKYNGRNFSLQHFGIEKSPLHCPF